METNKTKICYKCKKRKPRSSFYKRNSYTNWIASACKTCNNPMRKKNKEKELGRKLGVGATPYKESDIKKMIDYYEAGRSYDFILSKFPTRSQHAIESKLSEMGITSRKNIFFKTRNSSRSNR